MWQQLTLQISSEDCASLEQEMLECGALSITYLDAEDQAVFQKEPGATPMWDQSLMVCLFEADVDLGDTLSRLRAHSKIGNGASLEIEILEDQEWERSWMTNFQPMRFGDKLWICPSWQQPPDPAATTIMLDPGLAFGSGSHATTSLCLGWLARESLHGLEVIDYGCGSGVLAIAAALLGAARVHAVDHDPQALVATEDNSRRNGIDARRIIPCLPQALPGRPADLLLANILAEPLLQLAEKFSRLLRPGGRIVLSGMLVEQLPLLTDCYRAWFDLDTPQVQQDWALLSGSRRA